MIDFIVVQTVLIFGLAVLYEIKRQFKEDKRKGMAPFLERNWVRCVYSSLLIPGFGNVFVNVAEKISRFFS